MVSTNTKLAEALRLAREWFRHEEAGEGPQAYDVIKAADEAIAAYEAEQAAKAVPAGFVLVPVEFIEAGQRIAQDYARTNPKWPMWDNGEAEPKVQDPCGAHAWLERAAMLAAAPTPPAPEAPPYRMTAGEVDAMNRALTRSVRFVDEAQAAPEAQQTAGQEQDERDAFEAWATEYSTIPLERDDDDGLGTTGYTVMEQTMRWDAWQAAMAHASAAVEAVAVQMPRPASWSGAVTPERVEQMLADYRVAVLRALVETK